MNEYDKLMDAFQIQIDALHNPDLSVNQRNYHEGRRDGLMHAMSITLNLFVDAQNKELDLA